MVVGFQNQHKILFLSCYITGNPCAFRCKPAIIPLAREPHNFTQPTDIEKVAVPGCYFSDDFESDIRSWFDKHFRLDFLWKLYASLKPNPLSSWFLICWTMPLRWLLSFKSPFYNKHGRRSTLLRTLPCPLNGVSEPFKCPFLWVHYNWTIPILLHERYTFERFVSTEFQQLTAVTWRVGQKEKFIQ